MANDLKFRKVDFRSESFDEENRTVDIVCATDTPVKIGRVSEVLEMTPEAIDAGRITAGAVYLIQDHMPFGSPVGRMVSHRIEEGKLIGTFKLSGSEERKGIVGDIQSGVFGSVSIGFKIHDSEETNNEDGTVSRKVTKWEPYETSLTVIPADVNSSVRSDGDPKTVLDRIRMLLGMRADEAAPEEAVEEEDEAADEVSAEDTPDEQAAGDEADEDRADETATDEDDAPAGDDASTPEETEEEDDMSQEAVAAERSRAKIITELAVRHKMGDDFATRHIDAGSDVQAVKDEILEGRAADAAKPISGARANVTVDETEKFAIAATDALTARMTGEEPSEAARSIGHMGLHGIASRFVSGGDRMSRSELADAAFSQRSGGMHTSGDMPRLTGILGAAAARTLARQYETAPRTFEAFVNRTTLNDFRPVERVRTSDAPSLKLDEHEGSEVTYGTIGESYETIKLETFRRGLRFSRQMFINDDLGGFQRILNGFGSQAAETEGNLVYDILTKGQKMSDGKQLFHSAHGNLINASLDVAGMSEARKTIRKQTRADGSAMNISAYALIVGPDLETDAEKLVSTIQATLTGDVNPFAGKLQIIVDQRIEGNDWFVTADKRLVDTIDLAFLAGDKGIKTQTIEDPHRDGMEVIARLDVSARAMDHRGLIKSVPTPQI